MIVDSHCHVSTVWFEPVEALLNQMDRNNVGQAVLVQILNQYDNSYQERCIERYPGRFASVVGIDASQSDVRGDIERAAEHGAAGIRLRPNTRSPGSDELAIWREAARLGLAVSCPGTSDAFASDEFFRLVSALPDLVIVLEHLGGRSQPDRDEEGRIARRRVFELARFPNVYLKVPGVGELSSRAAKPPAEGRSPFEPSHPPLLRDALTKFGANRLMWGSDFPPVSSREGYANALTLCLAEFADLTTDEQALIFGGVARRVFKLS
jgi:L-fuconolactonase